VTLEFLLANADESERLARLRELRVLVRLMCGRDHPCAVIFDFVIRGKIDTSRALSALDLLPARQRRDILCTFGALIWPNTRKDKLDTRNEQHEQQANT
jgi:hypothetical protein